MHKFMCKDGAWSIHKSVELNDSEPISTHIFHDSSVLVAFKNSFTFYNQEWDNVTNIILEDLVDGCLDYIYEFSHMAHGDENEFGLLVRVNSKKVIRLRSQGIEHSYTDKSYEIRKRKEKLA